MRQMGTWTAGEMRKVKEYDRRQKKGQEYCTRFQVDDQAQAKTRCLTLDFHLQESER